MVVAAIAIVVAVFVLREDPGAKPVDEAIEEFRTDEDSSSANVDASLTPPAGVYTATGEGQESLSFPPISQTDGAVMPATVTHHPDGCWTFTLDYNEAHTQTWRYCIDESNRTLVEQGGQTFQRWDLGALTVENTSTFVCDPPAFAFDPDAIPATEWNQRCEGTNSQTAGVTVSVGPYVFLEAETLTVGGDDIATHHYRQTRTLSGAQTGTQTAEIWIAVDDGLPLRIERAVELDSSSPVGTITYTENGWWQLTSRTRSS
jgi:hypothetical protein